MTDSTANEVDELDEVLAAGEARWTRHVQLLDWQPDYRIRGPEDPFTPTQEYAHQGHWLEVALAGLRARLDGTERPPRITDFDAQNAAWAEADAARTIEDAKEYATVMRAAYLDAAVGPARTDERVLTGLRFMLVDHFDTHFGYMVKGMLEHESMQWERMTAALDSHSRGKLHQGDDGVPWDATDIYSHLYRWMWVQFPRVEAFLATGEVPELDATVDELNALWRAEDKNAKFEAARLRAYRTRDRFRQMIGEVPIAKWTPRLVGLCAGNSFGHYQEHLGWIIRDA